MPLASAPRPALCCLEGRPRPAEEMPSNFVRLDPTVQVAAVNVDAPARADHDELTLVDEVLNGLLAPANIRRGFFDCEEPGWQQ